MQFLLPRSAPYLMRKYHTHTYTASGVSAFSHQAILPPPEQSPLRFHKFPYAMAEQLLLALFLYAPYLALAPKTHLSNEDMSRPIETAAVKCVLPNRRPESLPPRNIVPRTEHMLEEQQLASRSESEIHEIA